MQSEHFRDFDEFAAGVRGIDATMLLQNPARFSWDIDSVVVSGLRAQRGRLGSGNIVEGRSWEDGVLHFEGEPSGSGDGICRVTRPSREFANQFRIAAQDVLAVSANHPGFDSSHRPASSAHPV